MNILLILVVLVASISALSVEEAAQKGIVNIEPNAFHSMRHYFNRMIVFVVGNNTDLLSSYPNSISLINTTINETDLLFGTINLDDDVGGVLKEYQLSPGIKVVTERNIYSYDKENIQGVADFYRDIMHPSLKVVHADSIPLRQNVLIFEYPNASSFKGF